MTILLSTALRDSRPVVLATAADLSGGPGGGATITASAGDLLIGDGAGNAEAFVAGEGEVVFVDGSGHAATSGDLTFDAGSTQLTLGPASGEAAGTEATIIKIFGGPGPANDGFLKVGNGTVADASGAVVVTDLSSDADRPSLRVGLGDNSSGINFITATDAPAFGECIRMGPGASNSEFFFALNNSSDPTFFAIDDNACDLGTADFIGPGEVGSLGPMPWRTGYFGTSVVSPLFSTGPGADGVPATVVIPTVGTLTFVGGILTDFS